MEYKGYKLTNIEQDENGEYVGVSKKDGDMILCEGKTLALLKADFESAVDDLLEVKADL